MHEVKFIAKIARFSGGRLIIEIPKAVRPMVEDLRGKEIVVTIGEPCKLKIDSNTCSIVIKTGERELVVGGIDCREAGKIIPVGTDLTLGELLKSIAAYIQARNGDLTVEEMKTMLALVYHAALWCT